MLCRDSWKGRKEGSREGGAVPHIHTSWKLAYRIRGGRYKSSIRWARRDNLLVVKFLWAADGWITLLLCCFTSFMSSPAIQEWMSPSFLDVLSLSFVADASFINLLLVLRSAKQPRTITRQDTQSEVQNCFSSNNKIWLLIFYNMNTFTGRICWE